MAAELAPGTRYHCQEEPKIGVRVEPPVRTRSAAKQEALSVQEVLEYQGHVKEPKLVWTEPPVRAMQNNKPVSCLSE